jgi:hypothetical protein
MERKAALVGCKQGHWVRTSGMRRLHLNARVQRDAMICVSQRLGDDPAVKDLTFVGPGIHPLEDATWTLVRIADGSFIDALCILQTGAVNAVPST